MSVLIIIVLFSIAWLACGYTAAAMYFAYFQRNWPSLAAQDNRRDRREARKVCLTGPIGLLALCTLGDYRHGLIWDWPRSQSRRGY